MIPTEPNKRRQVIEYMIEGIEGEQLKLSDWEVSFIYSVSEQFLTSGNLSDRQCEILEKIYDKVTG